MAELIQTARLVLRRPAVADAEAIFERYASDPEVTRYLSWPRHRSIDDTLAFLEFSDAEWKRWKCGPLLAFSQTDGTLLGSSGLGFETADRAVTGYVFARDAWGKGYATEALRAMVDLAASLNVGRLYATAHVDHRASWRVMEKCGFDREAILRHHTVFPNLSTEPADVVIYSRLQRAP
jgi:RimJ/RimL family protein N-acetyltransferase